ncbi:hypothetical protein [Nocardioides sp. Soil796]|uniref:hypothetical protein n=1 Tax=Nocardioides sp. Soil796 TaxID=1736412 RepID=UPI0012E3C36A|nr:hypothetical protein [Nocardioides sp. Soil796]
MPVPFTAVATDLLAQEGGLGFRKGPWMRPSEPPLPYQPFISPVVIHGRLLADGGLLNPIPVAATTAAKANATVAVSLSEESPGLLGTSPVRDTAQQRPTEEWLERFQRIAGQVLDRDAIGRLAGRITHARGGSSRQGPDGGPVQEAAEEAVEEVVAEVFGVLPPGLRTRNVMELSLGALQRVVVRYRLASYPPDVLITVPTAACRMLEFQDATEMIALGRQLATEALDEADLLTQ